MRNGHVLGVLGLVGLLGLPVGCASPPAPGTDGDVLRVALTREPTTWNRLLAQDYPTHVVTDQLHAPLIRLNHETQEMEPALAESWAFSEDGRELTFRLRDGVRFSDGALFTAADVVFTFAVLHDPIVASPLRDSAVIDGENVVARAVDDRTVSFALPRRTAAIERIFDSIRILPEHRLADSFAAGTLAADTGPGAPVDAIVGLGPFRLKEHRPGERVVLERNPHYYRSGEEVFPKSSGIAFEFLPDASARVLRLRAGQVDLLEPISADAFRELHEVGADGVTLTDLGASMTVERLWFNLNPESPIDEHKKAWFRDVRFRRAVSLAIDRRAMARVVFDGLASAATGPVSPANHFWRDPSVPAVEQDLDRARALLEEAGFQWRENELVGAGGRKVRFTLVTNAGSDYRRRASAFIQEDLSALGMDVTVTQMDGGAMFARVTSTHDYDACLLGLTQTDPDPSAATSLWLSRGPLHLWHPAQLEPATDWEARIDALMESVATSVDADERRARYHALQQIVVEKLPVIDLVVPHALVGYRTGLLGLRPTPFSHNLWNGDELFFDAGRRENPTSSDVTQVTDRAARRE